MKNQVDVGDEKTSIDKNVAIVGIGCRYPNGINNPHDFWEMLKVGLDCTKCHPKERLDPSFVYPNQELPGKIYCRAAGYLSQDITEFDRLFFRMSPDEAAHMDPQIRLLLEVAWESLEDYGVNTEDLRKSNTGVYVGVMAKEYVTLISFPELYINNYTASGNNSNMMSNRISYQFDFQGPSITYDTACSSSMYAIHHACEAILNGDCSLALAGGVNLFLLPSMFVSLCQAKMVSPDGKCKSFDSSADGYARGEGAGIVVLKLLNQAIKDGDRIYAVIRGGALNNDGRTSGITSPNAQSQILLLKRAYENANVCPQEVPYVEAHGTGTQAGDTAEANALGSVMGCGRGDGHHPLIVGSVKSNFGHTEGAAGVAGVIKTALVLKNKKIPKLLHFRSKNKNVNWDKFEMTFPTYLMDWPEGSEYLAGCSSFGFGGANAHLVLQAAPTLKKSPTPSSTYFPALLVISAASKDALDQRASDWLKFLNDSSDKDFCDILLTAATRATHHPYRIAICCQSLAHSIQIIKERQSTLEEGTEMIAEGRVETLANDQKQKLVFVFTGMGTQWWGMGRQLMMVNAVFREMITAADKLLGEFGATWSLLNMLTTETNREEIHDTEIAQPSICALQIALAEVYRQMGVLPHAVIGHSVGEVAAACVAGYITFRDAMRLIYIRGKLLKSTSGKGTMAAILLQASKVREKLSEPQFCDKVDIACVNSPTQTVISGNVEAIETIVNHFQSEGVRCVRLKVQNAFHSFQQEDIKETFFKVTGTKFLQNRSHYGNRKHSPRQVPMVSTVNGEFLTSQDLNNTQYWWENIRRTVEFEKSLRKLFENGYSIFLEIGPHPSLTPAIKNTMAVFSNGLEKSFHDKYAVVGSLKRPADLSLVSQDETEILLSIAKLYVQGYPLNLEMLFPEEPFNAVSLPTYPWQRQQCIAITDTAKNLYISPRVAHPLLGESLLLYNDDSDKVDRKVWKSMYNRSSLPWLSHHKLETVVILPGAAYIEMMLSVAKEVLEEPSCVTLDNVQFHKFHDSPECKGSLNTNATRFKASSQWEIAIRTFNEDNRSWAKNASCTLDMSNEKTLSGKLPINEDEVKKTWKAVTREQFYKMLDDKGTKIGDTFKGASKAFYNYERHEVLVYANLLKSFENDLAKYVFHPSLLDAALQSLVGFSFQKESMPNLTMNVPKSVGNVTVNGAAPSSIVVYGQKFFENSHEYANLTIANAEDRKIFAKLENVHFAAIGSNLVQHDGVDIWEKKWIQVAPLVSASDKGLIPFESKTEEDYLIISDDVGLTDLFYESLTKAGISRDHVKVCNLSKGTNLQTLLTQGGNIQNLIVLTFMNNVKCSSLDDISRERFIRSQINEPMLLTQKIIELHSNIDLTNLSVWIVTQGAVIASESDRSLNPLMSNGYSLVMNFMNEFPELMMTSLDLPMELSTKDSARWLSTFFLQPERSENYLVLRPRNVVSNDELEFGLFSPRLKIRPSSSVYFNKESNDWMIDISTGIKSIMVKPAKPSIRTSNKVKSESFQNMEIIIQTKAFTRQYRKSISKSNKLEVGFLFGGCIKSCPDSNGKLKTDQNVLGYKRCNKVTTVVKSRVSEIVPIPPNASVPEALFVVQSYFPIYLALQETFKMTEKQVVMLTSDNSSLNLHLAFGEQISSCKGSEVDIIIYVQTAGQLNNMCVNHGNLKVTTAQSLHTEVPEGSVDTLLIHSDFTVRSQEAETLFSKVRFYGTIATLGDIPVPDGAIRARQIGVRVVEAEAIWTADNDDLRNQLIDSLLKLLLSNGHLSETMNHLVKNMNFDEVGNQAIDDKGFDKIWRTKPTLNVSFSYNDAERLFSIDSTSSHLVVGGTKGIGVEIARWLVCQGAMRVYISGRNAPQKHILQELNQMRKDRSVEYIACDITNENETENMLANIKGKGPFQLSIFHCAAVFEDQRLENMSEEAWAKVSLPKAYGLLLLHQCSTRLEIPIKEFVAISSIVYYLGNVGQGSYCNANSFMHSVCQERRLKNQPATVLAPGAIGEVGYAARKGFDKIWENFGMRTLSPSDVIHSLSWSLGANVLEFGFTGSVHRETFMKGKIELFRAQEEQNRFSVLKEVFTLEKGLFKSANEASNLFASVEEPNTVDDIENVLVDFLSKKLGLSEDVSKNLPLSSFGFDSAMSWELSSLILAEFNVAVSSVELLNDSAKISSISSIILRRSSKQNAGENFSAGKLIFPSITLWLHEPCELKKGSSADLFCFPPTGKGSTLFAEWGEIFTSHGIRVIVAQLPGWEGRENEKVSQDLDFLVKTLSDAIISRPKSSLIGFFGCGIGSLLAFEVARHLQEEHNFTISHLYISGWYPPSSPYPYSAKPNELDEESFTKSKQYEKAVKFLDNRDIRQIHVPRKTILNVKASDSICKSYEYVKSEPLNCNMTVFSGVRDKILTQKVLRAWKNEIDPIREFRNVRMATDHKLLRNKKCYQDIASHVSRTLLKEKATYSSGNEAVTLATFE